MQQNALSELQWLKENPPLEKLLQKYPTVGEEAADDFLTAAKTGRTQAVMAFSEKAKSTLGFWEKRIRSSGNNSKVIESALPHIVKSTMYALMLEKSYLASAAGKTTGKVRFNLWNGFIIQRLLFQGQLTRKSVSIKTFKFWWRFVSQKRILLPLVQNKGIYCFYSKELITEITKLIGDKRCLEIAAGDGTLASFIRQAGTPIVATDDFSWKHAIKKSENVEALNAKEALSKYQPDAVICSWPPAENNFEAAVFKTKSVNLYIVVGSRHSFVSGNWKAYESQSLFDWAIDEQLSSYVIPPESGHAVIVFRRR